MFMYMPLEYDRRLSPTWCQLQVSLHWEANTHGILEVDDKLGAAHPYLCTDEQRQEGPNALARAQIYRVREWDKLVEELPPLMTEGVLACSPQVMHAHRVRPLIRAGAGR